MRRIDMEVFHLLKLLSVIYDKTLFDVRFLFHELYQYLFKRKKCFLELQK